MSTGAEEVTRLRRVAYGPGSSEQERAAAEASLRRLVAAELVAGSDVQDQSFVMPQHSHEHGAGVRAEVGESTERLDGDTVDENEAASSFWRRSIRIAWIVPIVVGSIAVGYFGSLGPLGVMDDAGALTGAESPGPSASEPEEPGTDARLADLKAADSWFDSRPFNASDPVPFTGEMESSGLSRQDVRLALKGGDNGSVWVGRGFDGQFCLLFANYADGASGSTCVDRDGFAKEGMLLRAPHFEAKWFGRQVIASPPLVDSATEPPVLESGSGDVDAANAWFDTPAMPSDVLPDYYMLNSMGIDASDVRRVVPENAPWIEMWVAKQGALGFCVVVTDDDGQSSQGMCSPIAEFQEHGLDFKALGIAFHWDGHSFSSRAAS